MNEHRREPRIRSTIYTEEIHENYFHDHNARGYVTDVPWAVVTVAGLSLTAVGDEGLAGMQRLRDALDAAMAQARLAVQDADLAELVTA